MPTIDFAAIGGILADLGINLLSYAGIAGILYAIGGILIRTVSWAFDKQLINFIGYAYKYFETIVDGTLLTDSVVRGMMNRVYLLIGVIIAFRLGMLLFSYILNPSDVIDEKIGVNALVKRIVIGMILIIFIPNIFGLAFEIQKAILKDQVIEQIIMDENTFETVNEYKENHGIGKIIGMSVFSGFFHLSEDGKTSAKVKKNYEKATDIKKDYDLNIIDELEMPGLMNSGILTEISDNYVHDYFPIFSTVVLCYILYLLVKFCLDAVVRSFKLSILQIIAPIAIVEYMINSDRNEVFKTWRKASVATFAMLFMRVVSLWFVAYVTLLMQPGAIALAAGETTLLQTSDDLLKAVIILGLLAFMMEFPKLMSEIFGLDLEQDSSVKNVLGKAAGGAMVGLALGGAAVGAGFKVAGAAKGTLKGGLSKAVGSESFSKGLKNPFKTLGGQTLAALGKVPGLGKGINALSNSKFVENAKEVGGGFVEAAKDSHLGTTMKAGALAMGTAILASNQATKSAQGGYQQTAGAVDSKIKGMEQNAREQEYQNAILSGQSASLEQQAKVLEEQQSINLKLGVDENIDSVEVRSKADALSNLGKYSSDGTLLGKIDIGNQSVEAIRETTVDIRDNTNVIQSNTSDMVTQLDGIQDNTYDTSRTITSNVETEHVINNTDNVVVDNIEKIDANSSVFANMSEETFTDYQVKHHVDESSLTEKLTKDNSMLASNSDDAMDVYQRRLGVDEQTLSQKESGTQGNTNSN